MYRTSIYMPPNTAAQTLQLPKRESHLAFEAVFSALVSPLSGTEGVETCALFDKLNFYWKHHAN